MPTFARRYPMLAVAAGGSGGGGGGGGRIPPGVLRAIKRRQLSRLELIAEMRKELEERSHLELNAEIRKELEEEHDSLRSESPITEK